MSSPLLIVVLCVLSSSYGLPMLEQSVFTEFMKTANLNSNSPRKEGELVKRNTFEQNADAELKRISLQALIGNLETSLYKSALSVSNVPHDARSVIEEVKPPATERGITKRNTEVAEQQIAHNSGPVVGIKPEVTTESLKVLLQTTEKVPEKAGVPAHILIDRISIEPHSGGLPLIPAFQVHYSKITAGLANLRKDIEQRTKTSITETNDATHKHAAGSQPNADHTTAVGSTTESSSTAAHHDVHHEGSSTTVAHHEGSSSIAAAHEGSSSTAAPHEGTSTTAAHQEGSSTTAVLNHGSSAAAQHEQSSSKATIEQHTSSTTALNEPSSTTAFNAEHVSSTTAGSTEHSSTSTTTTSTTSTTSTTTPTPSTSSTTKTPIVELKEAEEELREKVAEIEAEPIIFSSRI